MSTCTRSSPTSGWNAGLRAEAPSPQSLSRPTAIDAARPGPADRRGRLRRTVGVRPRGAPRRFRATPRRRLDVIEPHEIPVCASERTPDTRSIGSSPEPRGSRCPSVARPLIRQASRRSRTPKPTTVNAVLAVCSQVVGATPPDCVDDPRRAKGWVCAMGGWITGRCGRSMRRGSCRPRSARSMGRPPDWWCAPSLWVRALSSSSCTPSSDRQGVASRLGTDDFRPWRLPLEPESVGV
jgi:hypothetical protein